MRIGLGGGAASSLGAGTEYRALDFDSVQRGNRRDAAPRAGSHRPLLGARRGQPGALDSRCRRRRAVERDARTCRPVAVAVRASTSAKIPVEESGMSPLEIWCNESQERYALAVAPERLPAFEWICRRERAPYAVVGEIAADGQSRRRAPECQTRRRHADEHTARQAASHAPRARSASREACLRSKRPAWRLEACALDVLRHPTVASKASSSPSAIAPSAG